MADGRPRITVTSARTATASLVGAQPQGRGRRARDPALHDPGVRDLGTRTALDIELFNINFVWLKSLTLFKSSPQPLLLLFVTVVTVVQRLASRNAKKPGGKTRKYLEFPRYFRVLDPHWTLEVVVGHCQAFLIVVQPA